MTTVIHSVAGHRDAVINAIKALKPKLRKFYPADLENATLDDITSAMDNIRELRNANTITEPMWESLMGDEIHSPYLRWKSALDTDSYLEATLMLKSRDDFDVLYGRWVRADYQYCNGNLKRCVKEIRKYLKHAYKKLGFNKKSTKRIMSEYYTEDPDYNDVERILGRMEYLSDRMGVQRLIDLTGMFNAVYGTQVEPLLEVEGD